jgi:amino acid transporter
VLTQDAQAEKGQKPPSLGSNRLGVSGVVFFVVAAAAPLVGMTGVVPGAIVLGDGAGVPGAFLAVGIILLLFSVGYSAMSGRVTNTGAFFAFVGRGLGLAPGVGSAFVSLLAYLAIQMAGFGFLGSVFGAQMEAQFGWHAPWWLWAIAAALVILILSLFSVDIGAKVLGGLMLLEVSTLALTAVAVIVHGGGPDGFALGSAFLPQHVLSGPSVGIAFAFAFTSFLGFEATAIYGEESRDPKRTVPRATYLAVILITALFALTSWAIVSGLGASHVSDRAAQLSTVGAVPLANPPAVLYAVAGQYVGSWLPTLMSWLVISSMFAGGLAFQNCAARYFFSMSRAGVLPRALARTNRRGSPFVACLLTTALALTVVIVFAVRHLDPIVNLMYWLAGLAAIAMVLIEILVSIAVLVYFRKNNTGSRIWTTVVAPILSAAGLAVGLYLVMSRFGLLAGTTAEGVDPTTQTWGLNITGWVLVGLPFALLIGGTLAALGRRNWRNVDGVRDFVS